MPESSQPPHLRTFTSLHKMPSNSSKLLTLLHTLISSQISRAKSFLLDVLRDGHPLRLIYCGGRRHRHGSFRLHYNWCSSRSLAIHNSVSLRQNYLQYDATTWNVAEAEEEEKGKGSAGLSGYLRWLEERKPDGGGIEIDELADMFIAKCREKFVLEKQESERRFQEMQARSV